LRAVVSTIAPISRSRVTTARPIPFVPPVTSARWPSSSRLSLMDASPVPADPLPGTAGVAAYLDLVGRYAVTENPLRPSQDRTARQDYPEVAMAQTERYEILILGSGAGGKLLAWHMARSGRRTAVVERRWIGGSCPNVNCLPSKNEIQSAKV